MSILFEENIKKQVLINIAEKMLIAARTAPKARGVDNLILSIADNDEIVKIADNILRSEVLSVAMDARVDNRVMFSVGKAIKKMQLLGSETKIIFGIPLSSSSKNIFFDRK